MYKSSSVAEMGDHGHNRHGPKSAWFSKALPILIFKVTQKNGFTGMTQAPNSNPLSLLAMTLADHDSIHRSRPYCWNWAPHSITDSTEKPHDKQQLRTPGDVYLSTGNGPMLKHSCRKNRLQPGPVTQYANEITFITTWAVNSLSCRLGNLHTFFTFHCTWIRTRAQP